MRRKCEDSRLLSCSSCAVRSCDVRDTRVMARPRHDNGIPQVGCSSCAGSPGGDLPRRPSLSGRATCSPIANCMVQPACHLKGSLCVRGVLHDVRQQVGAFNSSRTC